MHIVQLLSSGSILSIFFSAITFFPILTLDQYSCVVFPWSSIFDSLALLDLSCGNHSEVNEHDVCGHVLGAIPASRVRLSDVVASLSVEQQAWIRWWAADLPGGDSVQFAGI